MKALLLVVVLLFAGCATRVVIVPADREVHYLPEGKSFTAGPGGTWLVPPATFTDMIRNANRP
ncbi:hypothetical protein D4Q85_00215 [bacterium]|nr:MAG: hypothetical protein D4Q85_00215 [bacterium]